VTPRIKENDMSARLDWKSLGPNGLKPLAQLHGYVQQSGLPAGLVDLVYLRTSQINSCAFCIDVHSADLLKRGEPVAKVMLVSAWREAAGLFDTRERAALAWAEAVTRLGEHGVPDAVYQDARAVFSEKELVDLTFAVALMNVFNRMNAAFHIEPAAVTR
jgi:AhpD family alkylhydroperoxidase